MSKGYVQVNMTGHVEDFNNVKFVQRGSVEKLNTKIKVNEFEYNIIHTSQSYFFVKLFRSCLIALS